MFMLIILAMVCGHIIKASQPRYNLVFNPKLENKKAVFFILRKHNPQPKPIGLTSDFSAKEPSLGYLYQIKCALLLLIESSKTLDSPQLRIENLDDIEIETNDALHLYQTKLHIKNKGNLTDASVDFWKTIRIWSEYTYKGTIDLDTTSLTLVTTELVPTTSVLSYFKKGWLSKEEVEDVVSKLDTITLSSTNTTNSKGYAAFQRLDLESKHKLISKVRIFDNSVNIEEADRKLRKEVALFIYPHLMDAFLEILEGWWLRKALEIFTNVIDSVGYNELQMKISDIRDSFSADNLPNHFPDQLEISDDQVTALKERTFLKQLELIALNINSNTVKRAISDFRRAFDQRSKWVRLDLLNPDEEEKYDKNLQDYWSNIFDIMKDECEGKGIDELKQMGRQFYIEQFAKNCPKIKIREKFNQDYLTRGSYQMLADIKKIGWHPNFDKEL